MQVLLTMRSLAFLCISPAILSGCGYLQAQSRIDPQVVAAYSKHPNIKGPGNRSCPSRIAGDTRSGAINLDCFTWDDSGETAYSLAVKSDGDRNRLMDILVGRSNTLCNNDLARLVANEATVNTSLSIATSALSAAATIVTGDQASNILSGLAGTTNASRSHINAEVYRNTLSPVVVRRDQGRTA